MHMGLTGGVPALPAALARPPGPFPVPYPVSIPLPAAFAAPAEDFLSAPVTGSDPIPQGSRPGVLPFSRSSREGRPVPRFASPGPPPPLFGR